VNKLLDELEKLHGYADFASLPRAYGVTLGQGDFRCAAEDFRVSEAGIEPCGEGEHLYIRARKTGQNTRWVAKQIAEALELPYRAVSYAGLKDRHAVTEQWFAAHLPGRPDPEWDDLYIDGVEILQTVRHSRKLRPGQLSYNAFDIVLRNCRFSSGSDVDDRLQKLAALGVPNFYGPQRFGRAGSNLEPEAGLADLATLPRERRSFVISALRSALFNGYLARRVGDKSWEQALQGEVSVSDRPRGIAEEDTSVFQPERMPAGLLWGNGVGFSGDEAGELERSYFADFPLVCSLLQKAGSRASRRVLRARVANLVWRKQDSDFNIGFMLGPGSYATTVLREVMDLRNRSDTPDTLATGLNDIQ
jgi:tRNA pseudouridine13 synthase